MSHDRRKGARLRRTLVGRAALAMAVGCLAMAVVGIGPVAMPACSEPVVCSATASPFVAIDLAAHLSAHPLMKQYDIHTRRFRGTASAYRDVPAMTRRLQEIASSLAEIDGVAQQQVAGALRGPMGTAADETAFFAQARQLRWRSGQLLREREELREACRRGGQTPPETMVPLVAQLVQETLHGVRSGDGIGLNHLPVPALTRVPLGGANLYAQYMAIRNIALLQRYLAACADLAPLFPGVDDPVVVVAPAGDGPGGKDR